MLERLKCVLFLEQQFIWDTEIYLVGTNLEEPDLQVWRFVAGVSYGQHSVQSVIPEQSQALTRIYLLLCPAESSRSLSSSLKPAFFRYTPSPCSLHNTWGGSFHPGGRRRRELEEDVEQIKSFRAWPTWVSYWSPEELMQSSKVSAHTEKSLNFF